MHRSNCVRSAVVGPLKNGAPRMSPETTDGRQEEESSHQQDREPRWLRWRCEAVPLAQSFVCGKLTW